MLPSPPPPQVKESIRSMQRLGAPKAGGGILGDALEKYSGDSIKRSKIRALQDELFHAQDKAMFLNKTGGGLKKKLILIAL